MSRPVIITCAVTGGNPDAPKRSPFVPVTPQQIADECIAAARAGAHIAHIHVRDPESGLPSIDPVLFREVVHRIRDSGIELMLNLSTGYGAQISPSPEDPGRAGPGSNITTPQRRLAHVLELRPEICSLDVATMNLADSGLLNVPGHLEIMAELISGAGVKPELEVFDHGQLRQAIDMVERGLVLSPPLFQICLGVKWGAPADTASMLLMHDRLPPGAAWAGFGISKEQFPMAAQSVILGGHVRVGLEDNLYLSQGELSPGNAPLVERGLRLIEALGERRASFAEARELLGIS